MKSGGITKARPILSDRAGSLLPVAVFVVGLVQVIPLVMHHARVGAFGDFVLYWEATSTWLGGGDPWATTVNGIRFAGIPPTLLLNLPLQAFGPGGAQVAWVIGGAAAGVFVFRRLRLEWWWLAFPPFWEGYLAGSPDPVLLALSLLGLGAVAALTKPYSVPGMLGVGQWRSVVIAGVLGLVSIPLLPWGQFLGQLPAILAVLSEQATHTSAWGSLPLMAVAVASMVVLGPRMALGLATPLLWPSAQTHYGLFSVPAVRRSPALVLALSLSGVTVLAVAAYALWTQLNPEAAPGGSAIAP